MFPATNAYDLQVWVIAGVAIVAIIVWVVLCVDSRSEKEKDLMINRTEEKVKATTSVWVIGSPPSWYSPGGTRQVQVETILQAADELRKADAPANAVVNFESPGGVNGIHVVWEAEE